MVVQGKKGLIIGPLNNGPLGLIIGPWNNGLLGLIVYDMDSKPIVPWEL